MPRIDAIEKFHLIRLHEFAALTPVRSAPVMPDDHSKSEPLLPIPNRTVKQLRADDSADPRVKVGHRQAVLQHQPPGSRTGGFRAFRGCIWMSDQVYRLARRFSFIRCRIGCSALPMRNATQVASTSMISRCSRRDTIGL